MKSEYTLMQISQIFSIHPRTILYHLKKHHLKGHKVYLDGKLRWQLPEEEVFKLFKILTKEKENV